MSLRGVVKRLRCFGVSAFVLLAAPVWCWAQQPAGCASGACFGTPIAANCGLACCQSHHCPPPYQHCMEGPPHIHWKTGCPHPICNPCELPHWGYYDTCWTPWPFPPDWTHCPTPPPAAFVNLNPQVHPSMRPGTTPRQPVNQPGPGVAPAPTFPGGGVDTLPQPQRYESPRPPF